MRKSDIKIGINCFLDNIKFGKEYYQIYNNIFDEKMDFTYDIFVYYLFSS